MFNDNKVLGQFDLVGLPPAPRGIPQIEVAFDIDANGILHVNAKDMGTGKEQGIRITAPNKLSEEEVERMRKQAEEHAEEDKRIKAEIETINNADNLVYSTEKLFKDFEGKVDGKELGTVKGKILELKELLKAEKKDAAAIKSKMDEVNEIVQKMSTEMYQKAAQEHAKQQQSHGQQGNATEDASDDENVVDADYKVEDEEKGKKK